MRILILTLLLSGCAGHICRDGVHQDLFGDCSANGGTDWGKSYPGHEWDRVEQIAYETYLEFHDFTPEPGIDRHLYPRTLGKPHACVYHATSAASRLARDGISYEFVDFEVTPGSWHRVVRVADRVIDLNFPEPRDLNEYTRVD